MIASGIATSYKREILDGIHDAGDEYMIALFSRDADIGPDTKSYAGQDGEVRGAGYVEGGQLLKGRSSGTAGTTAYVTFSNPRWSGASFSARGALIYNASKADRAVAVINFGQDFTCTSGEFAVSLPAAGKDAIVVVA
jgi:hypothetical protein